MKSWEVKMATQLAPTPVVTGKAAEIIYSEMQSKPSETAKQGAQILLKKFSEKVK